MGTPRGRWPRARGKGKQGARWGVGGRTATERNSFSAWGVANLLSPGPRVLTRPTSGSAGPPRSAAPAPSHAPLTRHLSPGLRFVCAFFFPSSRARHRPPAASSPPPPPSASLPRADYLSRAVLRVPGMPSAPRVRASHRQATQAGWEQRWGRQGRGARAGQNLRPRRSPAPIQSLEGGAGARCERGAGSLRGEMERTGAASIWGESERGGEERQRGRGERRERERCSDRDCHWGQRSTAPGSWAAPAPLSVSSPPGPRALHAPAVVPAHSNPPPAP